MTALCPQRMAVGSARLLAALRETYGAEIPSGGPRRSTVRGLIEHVAVLAGVSVDDVSGRGRFRWQVDLRRAVAVVARDHTGFSYPMIGRFMDDRDHSTVMHLCRTGEEKMAREPEFAAFVERLWAAGECAPWGPGPRQEPEPAEIGAFEAVPLLDEAPDLPDDDEVELTGADLAAAQASAAFMQALRRAHPERVPHHVTRPAPRAESVRGGYCWKVIG